MHPRARRAVPRPSRQVQGARRRRSVCAVPGKSARTTPASGISEGLIAITLWQTRAYWTMRADSAVCVRLLLLVPIRQVPLLWRAPSAPPGRSRTAQARHNARNARFTRMLAVLVRSCARRAARRPSRQAQGARRWRSVCARPGTVTGQCRAGDFFGTTRTCRRRARRRRRQCLCHTACPRRRRRQSLRRSQLAG